MIRTLLFWGLCWVPLCRETTLSKGCTGFRDSQGILRIYSVGNLSVEVRGAQSAFVAIRGAYHTSHLHIYRLQRTFVTKTTSLLSPNPESLDLHHP